MHWLGQWGPVWAAAAWAVVVAVAGGVATRLGPWYDNLRKPSWQPPDWLFGPAWTLIFGLTAASGVLAWWGAADGAQRWLTVGLF
ncbi:MAG: tryptophan-rich sensory protein, partial [Acetobacteraceae bacterium]|nr:tryptophan-rich sensory protein [Acetobacteraceae bacterium]